MPRSSRSSATPHEPRIDAPDIPEELDHVSTISPRSDVMFARLDALTGSIDASHGHLTESVVDTARVSSWTLLGATLRDVEIRDIDAVEWRASDGRWRTVRVTGGRVATLDLSGSELDTVEFVGLRIDYLTLARAEVSDVRFTDCTIGTLDLPHAVLTRVGFENCRIDEIDPRNMRAEHVDLRSAAVAHIIDPRGLAGVSLTAAQCELHAAAFAQSLGIRIDG